MQICERFCPCFQEKYVEYVTNITNSKKAGNIYFESDVVGLNIFICKFFWVGGKCLKSNLYNIILAGFKIREINE